MKVLVGYDSAYGSTKGIAKEIARRLTQVGLLVDALPVEEIDAIENYDAVVLGSAIHNMAWLPRAAAFMRGHTADLRDRPLWLFSVSSVGETSSFFGPRIAGLMRRMRREPNDIAGFRQTHEPRDHRTFAGAVERTHWSLAGHLFLKAFGGSYGDHRDWSDIDAWADRIAQSLQADQHTTSA
jgi:menaquinone-dependent protoporphyrinogen oxidase